MIYITGDTHGSEHYQKLHTFAGEHPELTLNDYVIIAGDFGAVWSESTLLEKLSHYTSLPFTILFVDGNHENFDMINAFPVETWKGGKVHKIRPNIIHLMRGQVFEIEGKTFFTFGGATSIDRNRRTEGKSWWAKELPSYEELDEGVANLKRYSNAVDYIITHSCSERALMYLATKNPDAVKFQSPEVQMLSYIEDVAKFEHWYFGHFHMDVNLSNTYTVLFENIVKVK